MIYAILNASNIVIFLYIYMFLSRVCLHEVPDHETEACVSQCPE